MLRRACRLLCSTVLLLVVGGSGLAADGIEALQVQLDVLSPAANVICSLRGAPAESFDPPTTSALQPPGRFVASLYYREDISPSAQVRIAWLGANFVRRFVPKIESGADETALQAYTLNRPSNDDEIIAALDPRHETMLADLWCLLRRHARGEGGALFADVVPHVFFVRDVAGELWVVDVIWGGAGWEIGASEVGGARRWSPGARVISR